MYRSFSVTYTGLLFSSPLPSPSSLRLEICLLNHHLSGKRTVPLALEQKDHQKTKIKSI